MYLKKTRSYQDLVTRLDEQLLLEYNDEFIKKYVGIFIKQNPNTTSEAITELIKRFDQLKSGTTKNEIKTIIKNSIQNGDIKAKEGDVDDEKRVSRLGNDPLDLKNYNYNDLEKVVHSFKTVDKETLKKAANVSAVDYGAKLVYEDKKGGIQIFLAETPSQSYAFKLWLIKNYANNPDKNPKKIKPASGVGRGLYGWCVAETVSETKPGTYFISYRFQGKSCYYVLNNKLPVDNNKHVTVIHVTNDKPAKYLVTSALNDGDNTMTWPMVVKYLPELQGHENVFKFIPFSEDEEAYKAVMNATPKDFSTFTSPRAKRAYILGGAKNKVYMRDFLNLTKVNPELTYAERNNALEEGRALQESYIKVRGPMGLNATELLNYEHRIVSRLLQLFADTSLSGISERVNKSAKLQKLSPLFNDPAMIEMDNPPVLNLWKGYIKNAFMDLNNNQE